MQLFQILNSGTVQCSGCNPALANTDTFYRLNVLDDSGNTAGPGPSESKGTGRSILP